MAKIKTMVRRDSYIKQILPFIDKDLVKVFMGVRRCGKSTLLTQIKDILLERGVSENRILNVNYESKRFDHIKDADSLYDYVCQWQTKCDGKVYLLFDEIQEVKNWEEAINSFRVDFSCDIYVTGSNSRLLSGELATNLRGRYVSFNIFPFSFVEARQYYKNEGVSMSDEKLFSEFLKYGGFPQRFVFQEEEAVKVYLSDLYETIVFKDVIERNGIKNIVLLRKLLEFFVDNIGNTFSANSIVKKLKSEGVKTSIETILFYIESITKSFALYSVPRYNITGKKLLETSEKYYCVDLGFRTILSRTDKPDIGHVCENLVYMELVARGWNVYVGKKNDVEIDFVCTKMDKTIYIQVAYLITDSDVEREFGNLESIRNNYPKYVISADSIDMSRNGIVHLNIIDFLNQVGEW